MRSPVVDAAISARYVSPDEPEFCNFGFDVSTSDDLITFIYETYFALGTDKGWYKDVAVEAGPRDIIDLYKNGLYVPIVPRVAFTEYVDLRNSSLPDRASILKVDELNGYQFIVVQKCRLPGGWIAPAASSPTYKLFIMWKPNGKDAFEMRTTYFCVRISDGKVLPCLHKAYGNHTVGAASTQFWAGFVATVVLNAADDSAHLWHVTTRESVVSNAVKTPLILGCDPELVKSLFYARDMPLTDDGRRRPILHWVQAHRRRMLERKEIDVRKHLRGITEFDMGTFRFAITNPRKPST
jgi:hypothetical protein